MSDSRSTILIIDDMPENLRLLGAALATDFDLQTATSGPMGLALAMNSPPDLILLDVMMPGMDGFETCRRLKASPQLKDIPVIFITALTDRDSEMKALALGAVDYLTKPINVGIARHRIRNLLERERLLDESKRAREAQQMSEARYRLLASATFEGIAVTDQGCVTDANEQLLRMLGFRREELIGLQVSDLLPPEDRERVMANLRSGRESNIEHAIVGKDGLPIQVEAHGQTITIEGRTIRITALRDITARREAERAMLAAIIEAERANGSKSRFLAAASHDLRQPLSALTLYVDLLKNTLAPAHKNIVANMQQCIGSLNELLNDLLDLSKLEAGIVTPSVSDFSIADVFSTMESVYAPEALIKGLRLRYFPSELTGRTDLVLFRRCLGNLIGNALRYTKRGGVLIACRRRQGKTWVEVWDTGIGIPADKTVEIFEEFRQLGDEARNCGSGLGLAIVNKTAALLRLEINVRSRPGRGSVFAIELPLGQVAGSLAAAAPHPVAGRPLRVALVDDNLMVCDALAQGLRKLGHQVVATTTMAALLTELDQLPPDIVVSDYRLMHGETGFDVITGVRASFGSALPAILITGDTEPALLRNMTDRGIALLHKPVDLKTLQAYVADMTCQAM